MEIYTDRALRSQASGDAKATEEPKETACGPFVDLGQNNTVPLADFLKRSQEIVVAAAEKSSIDIHAIDFDNHDLNSYMLGVYDGTGDLMDLNAVEAKKDDTKAPEKPTETRFDVFVNQWKKKKIPDDVLIMLARKLCDKATGEAYNPDVHVTQATATDSDNFTGCAVSWDGVSQEWFSEVFMKTPEVEEFLAFGCRMWFVREYGIKEVLYRRGVTSGSVVDHMDKFIPPGHELSETSVYTKKPANTFISFTGAYSLDLFAKLIKHEDLRGRYLWLDTICVDQIAWKKPEMKPFKKEFMHHLRQRIREIGFTALMLERWDDLMLTLGQIWVIWELFSTATGEAELRVLLNKGERTRFVKDAFTGGKLAESVRESLADIDAIKAGASQPEDKTAILEIMEETGVSQVNACVIERMRQWLTTTSHMHLEERSHMDDPALKLKVKMADLLSDQSKLDDSEVLYREVSIARREQLGDKDLSTLSSIKDLATLFYKQGKLDDSEKLCKEALHGFREKLGNEHPSTLSCTALRASLFHARGELVDAEILFREVLIAHREQLGDKDPATLGSINNLACVLKDQGNLDDAEILLCEAMNGYREQLGDKNPKTLYSINNLAILFYDQRRLDDAERLYREALKGMREQLGDKHHATLGTINNLAVLLCDQDKLDDAEKLCREALNGYRKKLGIHHPSTLSSMNNLADILTRKGNLEESEVLYREVLIAHREQLGDKHPSTLRSINNLAALLCDQGKLDDAERLCREALNGFREKLGHRHPSTQSSFTNLLGILTKKGNLEDLESLYHEVLMIGLSESSGDENPDPDCL